MRSWIVDQGRNGVGLEFGHGVFRRNGVPYLFLSCGHWEHYHQPSDTPNRLNYRKMASIAVYAERVCCAAAGAEFAESFVAGDPVAFEAGTWRQALGILQKPMAALLGVPDFDSREHIDRAAYALRGFGL